MEEQDLREIGISDPQHRRKLLQAARALPKVTTSPAAWPLPPPAGPGRADHSGSLPGPRGNRSQQSERD